jgi:hypothetical protein
MSIKIGEKFGRLLVIEKSEKRNYYICKCDCETVKQVRQDHLKTGKTSSCGCLHKELASARTSALHEKNIKHGLCKSKTYSIWNSMRNRCNNKNGKFYSYYGGRGITVCHEWDNFNNFYADMGECPQYMTIDRIDNNKGYSKENCQWATRTEQQNNRNVCRFITWNGETHTITEWSRKTGIHHNTITERFNKGWQLDQVFSPIKQLDLSGLSLGMNASLAFRSGKRMCSKCRKYLPLENYLVGSPYCCNSCIKS